jgi:hypothetical protein
MSQSAPQRPVYKERAPFNRRIYFGAVRGVTAIPDACVELVVGLPERIAPRSPLLSFALVIYVLGHCSTNEPAQNASQAVQASQPALATQSEAHHKHRRRTHHSEPVPASSAPTTASSAR